MRTRQPSAWFPHATVVLAVFAAFAVSAASVPVAAAAVDSSSVKAIFADPPRQYASAPLWVWNDMLTEEQVVQTLRDLAGQQVKQAFVHPRPGLMTPYLSDEWFRLWKIALQEAERLDMNLWIYDENSYPSGFAGGWVPERMPESRGRGLHVREDTKPPKAEANTVGVFRMTEGGFENVTEAVRAGHDLAEGRYRTFHVQRAGNSPWHGNRCYVDLLYPGVTQKFLEITLDAYKREVGEQFGKRVPGVFTDEPNIRPAGGLPWTDDLPQQFEKRWGYRLTDHLPCLTGRVGDWKRVRHNYFRTLSELFIERWARPYSEYCAKNNLEFTGHYWDHEWPNCLGVPDNMAMYAWHQRPAIDILMNQYNENTHGQFGNARVVKEVASVANQLGMPRTLCELYGAGGWDLRFEDMKRQADWLYVLGVNTLDEHLSYITLRGARKADHPQSFSYHEPWWPAYHVSATYVTRLSAALSSGEQVNPVLLIEPTTTAWLYNAEPADATLGEIGKAFFDMVMAFERAQVEYDIGCEDILARHGSAAGRTLKVGRRAYGTVVLPPRTETLNARTMDLLEAYAGAGGTVLCYGAPPALVDGRPSDRGAKAAKGPGWKAMEVRTVFEMPPALAPAGLTIRRTDGDKGILFHHRRQLADGELLFLVNTSIEAPSAGTVESAMGGAERWDLYTGKAAPYPFEATKGGIKAAFDLPPSGSLLLFLSKAKRPAVPPRSEKAAVIRPAGPVAAKRIAPNVLTIDYMDVAAGGERRANAYFHAANQFAFQKNGMDRNPWDSAVQFRDELITKTFPEGSGVEATYRFVIEEKVPSPLYIVIERPDLYTVTCNGKAVTAAKNSWWLDKAFGKIDITAAAQAGENLVTIQASPFTIYHELEPAYVLGDFALKATDRGFVITPDRGVRLGKWNEQGCPFYAEGVSYVEKFDVPSVSGTFRVALPSWYGAVARVLVNSAPAGYVVSPPWECDVTRWIKPGENTIEVIVIGTLKNTLGPHHGKPPLGLAWPGMFHQGPNPGPPAGSEYSLVGYGLFEPFVLRNVTP